MKLLILAFLPYLVFGDAVWKKAVICEGQSETIFCKENEKISVERAFYGRGDDFTCPGPMIATTKCQAVDSMSIIGSECNGKSFCTITASNDVFGEPCVGTSKYVEVHFLCQRPEKWPTVVTCEGDSRTVSCPAGKMIKVKKAFYGRHDWSTCPHPSIRDLFCTAPKSHNKIKILCNGKQSCSVTASNSLFGDPCRGTYKYVKMSYKCKKVEAQPDLCVDEDGKPISGAPFEKPGDCDNFYQCSNGYLHTLPCAAGTAFNPEIGVCDHPQNVEGCH